MENNLELEATQEAYQKAVNGLVKKTKFLSLCFLAFFVFLKIASKEMTFFEAVEGAFGFTICLYLPFKICHQIRVEAGPVHPSGQERRVPAACWRVLRLHR